MYPLPVLEKYRNDPKELARYYRDNNEFIYLERYTEESFKTHDEWQAWFGKNRDRIYFSDVGGYKFRGIPEEYLKYVSGTD